MCPLDGTLNLSPILTQEDNMETHDSAGKALAAKPFYSQFNFNTHTHMWWRGTDLHAHTIMCTHTHTHSSNVIFKLKTF